MQTERNDRAIEGRVHLYQKIAMELREQVLAGTYGPGVLLPSETRLAEAFGTSRLTVKRALDTLRDEGLINVRRGFGWFVVGPPVRHGLSQLSTIEEGVAASGLTSTRKVLEFAFIEPPEELKELFGCDVVLKTTRLNLAGERPVAHVSTWCPSELATRLSHADVESSSLYDLLPVEIASAHQIIRTVSADAEVSALLDVEEGAPCLRSERTTYSISGAPVLFAIAVFPGDTTEYVVDLEWRGTTKPGAGEGHFRQPDSAAPPRSQV